MAQYSKFVFILFVFFATNSEAIKLTPFRAELTPAGDKSTRIFIVDNNKPNDAAIEVSVKTREIKIDGAEINNHTDDFVVYPSKFIVKSNSSKTIRVKYIGDKDIEKEKAYRFIVEQLPVRLDKTQKGIKFLVKYMAALFVKKKDFEPDLDIEKLQMQGNQVNISIKNDGLARASLRNPRVYFEEGNKEDSLTERYNDSIVKPLRGQTILAGTKRNFTLQVPEEIKDTEKFENLRLVFSQNK